MNPSDDQTPPTSGPSAKPVQKAASGQTEARETRLAAALRANLRRRKTGSKNPAE